MNPAISTFLGLVLFVSGCTVNTKEQDKKVKVSPSKINVTVKKQSSLMDPESKQERPKQKTAHTKIGSLQNKTAPEIILALGTPDFRRTDKPAQLWQYQNKKCILDLFLYPQSNTSLSVTFFDVRFVEKDEVAPQVCLQSILETKSKVLELK